MSKAKYRLIVNVDHDFIYDDLDNIKKSIVAIDEDRYHIISNNRSTEAKVVHTDLDQKVVSVEIDGEMYDVSIEDSYDLLVKEMGLSANATAKLTDIKAPMPGLVLDVLVKEGDQLQEGDSILILEAMKMENVLKAPGDLTIDKILVKKGDAVDKNQILIYLES